MKSSRDFLSKLKKARAYEGYVAGLCPFHDDNTPSLMVYDDGWFRCMACNKAGPHSILENKLAGGFSSPPDVAKYNRNFPSNQASNPEWVMKAYEHLIDFPSLRWYWKLRGIEDRIETAMLGFFEGWNVIPITSKDGDIRGSILRAGPQMQKDTGMRYIIPTNQPPMMYCPEWPLYGRKDYLVIVFGMIDALALSSLRYPVVACSGNRTAFKAEWLKDKRVPTYIIPDEGEEVEAYQLASQLGWRGNVVRLNYSDGLKDPADYLWQGKRKQLEIILANKLPQ